MTPGKLWTKEENNILYERYPTMGKRVMQYLPGRTYLAIKRRAAKLDLRFVRLSTVEAEPVVEVKKLSGVVPPTRKERIEDLEKIIATSERIDAGSIYVRICRDRLRELGAA